MEYRVTESGLGSPWKQGRTVDMSATGVLIEIADSLAAGSNLELRMNWPGLYHGKAAVRLSLTGAVVRADQRGTALRITRHEFRESAFVTSRRRPQKNLAVA